MKITFQKQNGEIIELNMNRHKYNRIPDRTCK